MKLKAIVLMLAVSACASTYRPDPNDPVDMTAELGNLSREYVAMGEVCDVTAGGAHRQAIVQALQGEQAKLGVLADLMNRAYRGHASDTLAAQMQTQMSAQNLSAAQFCGDLVSRAHAEANQRTAQILAMTAQPNLMDHARNAQRLPF